MENIIPLLTEDTVRVILMMVLSAASATGLYLKLIKPIWDIWTSWAHSYSELKESLRILDELKPNGGSSIKDAINRIDRKLVRNESIQKAIINAQDIPWFSTNQQGEIIEIGRPLCRVLRRSEHEILNYNWISWAQDRAGLLGNWKYCVENQMDFSQQAVFLTPQGQSILMEILAYQLDGKGYWGTIREI